MNDYQNKYFDVVMAVSGLFYLIGVYVYLAVHSSKILF